MDKGKSFDQGDQADNSLYAKGVSVPQPTASQDNESDWEDLDDVLDDFTASMPNPPGKPAASGPGRPQSEEESARTVESELVEDALLKQLEAGMAELMGARAPSGAEAAGESEWDALSQQLTESGMNPTDLMRLIMGDEAKADATEKKAGTEANASVVANKGEESFQDTIRKTMERMQASGDKATAAANEDGDGGDDMLAQLLKAMESGLLAGSGEGDDDNLDKIFMGIMEQLSNKEMLYEPMKELQSKFGPWLADNRDKVSKEERERYELQATIVEEIVTKFNEDGYADEKPEHRSYIWERMQKMQASGNPPEELISNPFSDGLRNHEALTGDGPPCPQQ